ncbi:imidazole glycerol phosphate synthase subunit HisH [Namhaeicola litoreus]|uniref:Imidazole glycerol phosphate synthase subunit HisH n=1 Tax=Namhaeicola litoreus TaxID=1052145 RepID=A0ABW3Y3N4_9FLAO
MNTKQNIVLIDYGAGNVQSVKFALNRLGYEAQLSEDADVIQQADKVIFPGVGEASSTMEILKEKKLDQIISKLTQPVLGICLGMQLLCGANEEGFTEGIGVFDVPVLKFPSSVKVPQIGWNQIKQLKSPLFEEIAENEYMYLVHSFYIPKNNYAIATSFYGFDYCTAIQKDNFYGVQFHPEKSSLAGEKLLDNFLKL